ncbi:16S rRNA (uracil1498-N3)-methyltransferase [Lachnospiraceae bacterium]|nr:16S rRNA (uracil1498-N3)-methyltransferase [Lachnospiraceae bacterium]
MYHFFTEPCNVLGEDIYLDGKDFNHIRNVLRMKQGEKVSVSDGISDKDYCCHIEDFEDDRVHLKVDEIKESEVELPVQVTLYQGLPKSDKMDLIVEKCVELGVTRIVPVACSRSVVKLDAKKAAKRVEHWNGKAEAAAKQSKRAVIPTVTQVMSMKEAMKDAASLDHRLIPYELAENFDATRKAVDNIAPGSSVGIFIGPEGGFSEEEIRTAEEAGITPITLGHRILRTETAAMVVLSWFIYRFEK